MDSKGESAMEICKEPEAKQPKLELQGAGDAENNNKTEEIDSAEGEGAEDEDSVEENEEFDEDEDFLGLGWDDDDIDLENLPEPLKREPPQDISPLEYPLDTFQILDYLPPTHKYGKETFTSSQDFLKAYTRDVKILQENLPPGIWVRGYEGRMDLFSVLIAGPQNTPYEGSLFAFEIQLTDQYPKKPPLFHYLSFHKERNNPNLYVQGKVCVSLLGTWHGQKASEQWTSTSSLLQVVLSIQALILVPEPYFNEPGYESSLGTPEGTRNSKDYNERVVLNLLESSVEMLKRPPSPWQLEITRFLKQFTPKREERISKWLANDAAAKPEFPLYPIATGYRIRPAVTNLLKAIEQYCGAVGL